MSIVKGPGPGSVSPTETYALPSVSITRRKAFSFGLARKLLAHYEGTPLRPDMRSVLDKTSCTMGPSLCR